MKKIYLFMLLFISYALCSSFTIAEVSPIFQEITVAAKGEDIPIEMNLAIQNDDLKSIELFYRNYGDEDFSSARLEQDIAGGNRYSGIIPARFSDTGDIEYYFEFTDVNNDNVYLPAGGSLEPFFIKVDIVQPEISLFSPKDGFIKYQNDCMISISYFTYEDRLVENEIQFLIDGVDVSSFATITKNILVYKPDILPQGSHTIKLVLPMKDGSKQEKSWDITVMKEIKRTDDVSYRGFVASYFKYDNNAQKSDYSLSDEMIASIIGNFEIRYKKIAAVTDLEVSSLENKNYQPVNRYSLKLKNPYAELIFGDAYPKYSEFTINGMRMRGFEAKLDVGFFKFDVSYGDLKRSVKGLTSIDSLGGITDTTFIDTSSTGTHRRTLLSFRPSFHFTPDSYWGLSVLKIKDDLNSIDFPNSPKDNLVLGTDLQLSFLKRKLMFNLEFAASLTNYDISGGPISKEDLDSLGFDIGIDIDPEAYEDIFVINSNSIPSIGSIAYSTGMKLFFYRNFFKLGYKHIGPSFNSLGNEFLTKDRAGFWVSDGIYLLDNQIYISAGFELYKDNVTKAEEDSMTTTYTNLSFSAGYYPGIYPSLYFDIRRNRSDSDDIDNTVNMFGIGSNYKFKVREISNSSVGISYNLSQNENELALSDTLSGKDVSNYIIITSSNRLDEIPLSLNLGFGFQNYDFEVSDNTSDLLFVFANAGYDLENIPLNIFGNIKFDNNNAEVTSKKFNFSIGSKYKYFKNNTVSLKYKFYTLSGTVDDSYNQLDLKIDYRF